MHRTRSSPRSLATVFHRCGLAAACGTSATPAPSSAPATATPTTAGASASPSLLAITPPGPFHRRPGPNGGVVVSWFVGLGAGTQPQQIAAEQKVAATSTPRQKDVYISLEIYNNNVAASILKTQIAAGNAPDIIGPVGVEGLNLFRDQLLDLAPLISTTSYSVPGVDPKLVDFFKLGENNANGRRPVRDLPVLPVLQQGPLRRGQAALPADQGRRPVPGQAVGHGRRPHAGHEAHRRQERQRRHQRQLRSGERRPVGLRHAVRRQQPAGRDVALRSQLVRRRRRQDRPDPGPGLDRREVVQRRRLEGSLHPERQTRSTATCSTRATSSSRATWR